MGVPIGSRAGHGNHLEGLDIRFRVSIHYLGRWIFRSIYGLSKFAMVSSCKSVTLSKRLFETRF